MKLNKASAYTHMQGLVAEIRDQATTYLKFNVHPSDLLPGDMIAATGQTVLQVFDHIFDSQEKVALPSGVFLVQFTQVTGLSVVRDVVVEIFRPMS